MSKWIWITAARLKIDSDCGRGSGVSQPNFWSIVAILLLLTFFSIKIQSTSWKCNELSFFNHCKSLDMTVHLWQCHIWSPTQSAKCNAAMQHVTKCYMSPGIETCFHVPCSDHFLFSLFWSDSPILHDHGLLAVCAFIRVLQFLH